MLTKEEFTNYCEIYKKIKKHLLKGGNELGAFFFEEETPISRLCDEYVFLLADHLPHGQYSKEEIRDILWELINDFNDCDIYLNKLNKYIGNTDELYDVLSFYNT